jgi:hypothetical protein
MWLVLRLSVVCCNGYGNGSVMFLDAPALFVIDGKGGY